jgi:SAM-dependent methyltransferase
MKQELAFTGGEADNWFRRNCDYILSTRCLRQDRVLKLLGRSGLRPAKVLEVGASNGFRLASIVETYGAECSGVEPSAAAVADGQSRFPELHLRQGVAASLPFADGEFDLVIVNFVLHWVDRGRLLSSVAEIDRVLNWEGHLILGDFLPPSPCRRQYHHLQGDDVWTYKQDYRRLFTASGIYQEADRTIQRHPTHQAGASASADDRTGFFLLRKHAAYVTVVPAPNLDGQVTP